MGPPTTRRSAAARVPRRRPSDCFLFLFFFRSFPVNCPPCELAEERREQLVERLWPGIICLVGLRLIFRNKSLVFREQICCLLHPSSIPPFIFSYSSPLRACVFILGGFSGSRATQTGRLRNSSKGEEMRKGRKKKNTKKCIEGSVGKDVVNTARARRE